MEVGYVTTSSGQNRVEGGLQPSDWGHPCPPLPGPHAEQQQQQKVGVVGSGEEGAYS